MPPLNCEFNCGTLCVSHLYKVEKLGQSFWPLLLTSIGQLKRLALDTLDVFWIVVALIMKEQCSLNLLALAFIKNTC